MWWWTASRYPCRLCFLRTNPFHSFDFFKLYRRFFFVNSISFKTIFLIIVLGMYKFEYCYWQTIKHPLLIFNVRNDVILFLIFHFMCIYQAKKSIIDERKVILRSFNLNTFISAWKGNNFYTGNNLAICFDKRMFYWFMYYGIYLTCKAIKHLQITVMIIKSYPH